MAYNYIYLVISSSSIIILYSHTHVHNEELNYSIAHKQEIEPLPTPDTQNEASFYGTHLI